MRAGAGIAAGVAALLALSMCSKDDGSEVPPRAEAKVPLGVTAVEFSGIPAGWRQISPPSSQFRDGRTISLEYTFWPFGPDSSEHEVITVCVSKVDVPFCDDRPRELIASFNLPQKIYVQVSPLNTVAPSHSADDIEVWRAVRAH